MDYAPYVYVIPESGPDLTTGKAVLAASFAIDFLCEAYSAKQFESNNTAIYNKIVEKIVATGVKTRIFLVFGDLAIQVTG